MKLKVTNAKTGVSFFISNSQCVTSSSLALRCCWALLVERSPWLPSRLGLGPVETVWLSTVGAVKSCTSRTWSEAALEYKPHFLQAQVAPKQHSDRSRGLKIAAQYGLNSTAFACKIVCLHFETILWHWSTKSSFAFIVHIPHCFPGFRRLRTLHTILQAILE